MKLEQSKSIGVRLSLIIAAVVAAGVILVSSVFIVQDFRKTVGAERARLENAATAFAAAGAAPLAARDKQALFRILRGIRDIEHVAFISVTDENGRPFAEMGSSVSLSGRDGAIDEKSILSLISASTLIAEAAIRHAGSEAGTLAIHSDISWLRGRYASQFMFLALLATGAAALIALVSNRIIQRMLRPLSRLSQDLMAMGDEPDLTHRFDYDADNEIGVLSAAFNDAFSRIQNRENALRRHRDQLEKTVDRRTRELRTAMETAERANAAKSQFLATMSHEIRTPMNGMMVMAELLAASPLAPRHQRYAEVISRSGHALLNIINDILDMSKIEAGKLELESIPFSVDALMEDTVSLFSSRAREKNLCLALSIDPAVAAGLIGDPTRLGQIISNLTNNALKFTETGGVTLTVSAEAARDGMQKIRFAVTDTGIGIADDKLDLVFEEFSQADQSVTRQFGGTGLGLSISRKLAHAMGGSITVESEEGKGTTFFLYLEFPVSEPAVMDDAGEALSIGVFDTCEVSAEATGDALGRYSMNVIRLSQDPYDSALDLILVNANCGADFAQQRDSVWHDVPLILLDSSGSGAFSLAARLKADAVLPVPLTRANIARLIVSARMGDFTMLDEDSVRPSIMPLPVADFGALSVLAVDDNAVNREVLNEALSALRVKAVFAESGEEAVALAAENRFDVVFMDCSMPGMDGYRATALIREGEMADGRPRAAIYALTATMGGHDEQRWAAAGMDGYMTKPFTVAQLSNALAKVQIPANLTIEEQRDEGTANTPDPDDMFDDMPLLDAATLSMFETIGASNGVDMAARIFPMFIAQATDSAAAIRTSALETASATETRDLAHALKSMCSSSGAQRAAKLCDHLEVMAGEGKLPDNALILSLEETIEATTAAMQSRIGAPALGERTG